MPASFDLIVKNGKCFIDGQLKSIDIGISNGVIKSIKKIENTSGGITFSRDSQFIFYTLLNEKHQPKKVFRHKIGTSQKEDELIYEEFDPKFTVGMGGLTADEKFFTINTSDHSTSETHYFTSEDANSEDKIKLKLFLYTIVWIKYHI